MIHDEECAHFLAGLSAAYYQDPPHLILSFDESNWYLVGLKLQMRGKLNQFINTWIVTRKPTFLLLRPLQPKERNSPSSSLRKSKRIDLISNSGNTMHTILRFGIRRRDGSLSHECCNTWICCEDTCSLNLCVSLWTHTTPQLKAQAEVLGIHLIFIPKGITGKYQPLDNRIFGAIRSNGTAKLRHELAQPFEKTCGRAIEAELLLRSWNELSDSAVPTGWDFVIYPELSAVM
jgi:hypothetical protein